MSRLLGLLFAVVTLLTLQVAPVVAFRHALPKSQASMRLTLHMNAAAGGDGDILVRALRGEKVERTPVWLMRQV